MGNEQTNQFTKLINQFFENRYSKNLENKVHNWLIRPDNYLKKERIMRQQWDALKNIEDPSSEVEYEKIKKKLGIIENKKKKQSTRYLSYAATLPLLIIVFVGMYCAYLGSDDDMENDESWPMAVLSVPYGNYKQTKLAFGSEIWINSGSEISYNENVDDTIRIINLKGEAYLSVAEYNDIPFIVRTKYLDVKVMGTQFNVSAYPNAASTVVTLKTGSIEIKTVDNTFFTLNPNQQLVYNNYTGEVFIQDISADTAKDIADFYCSQHDNNGIEQTTKAQ